MSFPNIIYGRYGDEKVAQSTKIGNLPLGKPMVLPDGREYVHAKASTAAALSAGYLACGSVITVAGTSTEFGLVAASAVVGATTVVVTLAAGTAMIADQWAEGYLVTASSTGTGIGRLYKVKTSNSAAAASTCTITLEPADPLESAIAGGTTRVGLRENLLNNVTVTPAATSLPGELVGVPTVAMSAGFYGWFQRKGYSSAYAVTGTALVTGDQVVAATGYAGAFGPVIAGTAWNARSEKPLGIALGIANTTGFTVVDLDI